MSLKPSKRLLIFTAAALIGGLGSYGLGLSGVQPGRLITEGRCRSGAFVGRAVAPKDLRADSQNTSSPSAATTAETDPATTINTAAPATGSNLLPNPGVEQVSGTEIIGWSNNHTGSNDAKFTQVLGHTSNRGLRIDITNFTDGTADWFTDFVKAQAGGYYEFKDSYRANVSTHATLTLKADDGKLQYLSIGTTPASTGWATYTARFFVPANVHQIMVSHTLDRVGALETDDYSLTQVTPGGFSEPLVSLTFDDGWESIHKIALPVMERYNVVSTQYIVSGFLGTPGYDTASQVYDFRAAGHEIASHTVDHPDLTMASDKVLKREITTSYSGLSKCFGDTTDFAAPYGAYNVRTTSAIKALYQTARSTDTGLNTADHFNPYELKVINVRNDTTPEQIQAWLDTAKTNHAWLILVYHQIDGSGAYSRTPSDFESDVQKVVASGIPVKTMRDAYAEVKPQLKR